MDIQVGHYGMIGIFDAEVSRPLCILISHNGIAIHDKWAEWEFEFNYIGMSLMNAIFYFNRLIYKQLGIGTNIFYY